MSTMSEHLALLKVVSLLSFIHFESFTFLYKIFPELCEHYNYVSMMTGKMEC